MTINERFLAIKERGKTIGAAARRSPWKTAGAVAPFAINAIFAGQTYSAERAKGHNPLYAAGSSAVQTWAFSSFFAPMLAWSVAPIVPMLTHQLYEMSGEQQRQLMPMSPWADTGDNPRLATQRQRALREIQSSRLNARQFIGNEGSLLAVRYGRVAR